MSAITAAVSQASDSIRQGVGAEFIICGVIGLLVNCVLLSVLIKKLNIGINTHTDIKLCTFVVVTDIFVSIGLLIRGVVAVQPTIIFDESKEWCRFDYFYNTQLLVFSGYSLGVMSLERFFLICFEIILPPFFWFFLVAATWIPPIIIAILVLIYPQELSVTSKSKAACTVMTAGPGYAYFLCTMTLFILSFICVISGYIGIIVVKFRQCLNQLNLNVPKHQVYKECRVTITKSFVYIFLYLLVFLSKFVIVCYELSTGKRRTLEMDAVSNCMVSCSVLANALVLLYMQNDVRVGFYEQLNKIKKIVFCFAS